MTKGREEINTTAEPPIMCVFVGGGDYLVLLELRVLYGRRDVE